MVRTIKYSYPNVNYWVTSNNAVSNLLLNALIDSWDVFLRNYTTDDLVNELVTLTLLKRLDT